MITAKEAKGITENVLTKWMDEQLIDLDNEIRVKCDAGEYGIIYHDELEVGVKDKLENLGYWIDIDDGVTTIRWNEQFK